MFTGGERHGLVVQGSSRWGGRGRRSATAMSPDVQPRRTFVAFRVGPAGVGTRNVRSAPGSFDSSELPHEEGVVPGDRVGRGLTANADVVTASGDVPRLKKLRSGRPCAGVHSRPAEAPILDDPTHWSSIIRGSGSDSWTILRLVGDMTMPGDETERDGRMSGARLARHPG
jgi:hypothetical protein